MDTEQPASAAPLRRTPASSRRPKWVDLSPLHLPPPGLVSIIHRVTGLALFFPVLPALLYCLQGTLGSEEGFASTRAWLAQPEAKLILLVVFWFYAHHFFAGIRYLLLDIHVGIAKAPSRASAIAVLVLGVVATVLAAWWLW